jgi:hypothetical protein
MWSKQSRLIERSTVPHIRFATAIVPQSADHECLSRECHRRHIVSLTA